MSLRDARRRSSFSCVGIFAGFVAVVAACVLLPLHANGAEMALPALRSELLVRADVDQFVRRQITFPVREGSAEWQHLRVVDQANTARVRRLIAVHGWLTRAMVGSDGAAAAWLLVQHAAGDAAFQRHCLDLIEALPPGEVSGEERALLTDRVLLAQGAKQRYGSQVEGDCIKGFAMRPLEDPDHVDERRAALGMDGLTAYLQLLQTIYCGAPGAP